MTNDLEMWIYLLPVEFESKVLTGELEDGGVFTKGVRKSRVICRSGIKV